MDQIASLVADPSAWAALLTLIVLEIVLGIDNLIFISILTNKLPEELRASARRVGLGLALVMRLMLLGTVAFIVHLTEPVVTLGGHAFSWRDLILLAGGLFLVWKATREIHESVDPHAVEDGPAPAAALGFPAAIVQILVLDLVFSIDSIVTAVGLTDHLPIMFVAVIVAVGVMALAAGPLAGFIESNPSIVMLALGFLLMIGMTLIADGFGVHVPKAYIYAAMAFSAFVETLNLVSRRAKARRRACARDASPASGRSR